MCEKEDQMMMEKDKDRARELWAKAGVWLGGEDALDEQIQEELIAEAPDLLKALLDWAEDLENRVAGLQDKHWVEETETLRKDSPAGREYQRMKDEHTEAAGTLAAMNRYFSDDRNVIDVRSEAASFRIQSRFQRLRAESWKDAAEAFEAYEDDLFPRWEDSDRGREIRGLLNAARKAQP